MHRHRKSGRALARSRSERVYALVRVLDAVAGAFHGDVARIDDFLNRPHLLLDGEAPLEWYAEGRSCILMVPSVVARTERNIIINARHPEFPRLTPGPETPVWWDERLFV